jgi:YidC/Oxa1 family membrane protein insertase
MQNESTRNTIIFVVSAVIILILYQTFVMGPAAKRREAEMARRPTAEQTVPGAPATTAAPQSLSRDQALAASPRVRIDTPALAGSISLRGGRIDDLVLLGFRQEIDRTSPPVELFRPEGAQHAWFADFGWTAANLAGLPNPDTLWTVVEGQTLAPGAPLTLRYASPDGLIFTRKIEVDDKFMFTITDTVANTSAAQVTLAPFASVQRHEIPADLGQNQIVHEGAVGWLGEELRQFKYKKWLKEGDQEIASQGGWVGITDKYWLAALVPDQASRIKGAFRVTQAGQIDIFDSNFVGAAHVIAPGKQVTQSTRLFAGAKSVPVLRAYEAKLGIPRFDSAVDWGNFWFLTRPIFYFLDFIYRHVGNFGIAILLLTVAVKVIFFPLANKSYESITKMKKIQPQVEEVRKKFKDDPAKQQQELLGLYQKEKINPLTGCLPMLIQIPVFYALYKVLTVSIEMRHAPFFGWVKDLSSRDPTTLWNLFGALPFDPSAAPLIGGLLGGPLHLGAWAVLYGLSMWLTTAMNPPAPDPIQQKIFQFMPLMFTFIMAPFAVGLLIYWTWNNVLSILQQYVIMRRFKVDNPIDQIIGRLTGKPKVAS